MNIDVTRSSAINSVQRPRGPPARSVRYVLADLTSTTDGSVTLEFTRKSATFHARQQQETAPARRNVKRKSQGRLD